MEFPVFLLRIVSVTCTVRSSEEQGAPRSTLRQPQWMVDICLCMSYRPEHSYREVSTVADPSSQHLRFYLLGLFTKEIVALTCM